MRGLGVAVAAALCVGSVWAQIASVDDHVVVARRAAARTARLPDRAGDWTLRLLALRDASPDARRHFLYGSGKKLASIFVVPASNRALRPEKGWSAVLLAPAVSGYSYTDPVRHEAMVVWLQFGQRRTAAARLALAELLPLARSLASAH